MVAALGAVGDAAVLRLGRLARVARRSAPCGAGDGAPCVCLGWDRERRELAVQTLEGDLLVVGDGDVEDYEPPPPEAGGFDALWPAEAEDLPEFGRAAGKALVARGYFVAQGLTAREAREEAFEEARRLRDLREFKAELAADVLGRAFGSGAALRLPPDDPEREPSGALAACDRLLTEAGLLLQPHAPSLGFLAVGRSEGLARLRLPPGGEASAAAAAATRAGMAEPLGLADEEAGVVEAHLIFVRRRKVCMIYIVESGGGELRLLGRHGAEVRLPLSRSKLVMFRHDAFAYEYLPEGPRALAVQCWMMAPVPSFELDGVEGLAADKDEALAITGAARPEGVRAQVLSAMTRFPGRADCLSAFAALLWMGTDCDTRWPIERCDLDRYFSVEPDWQQPKSYTCHGGWLATSEVTGFDNAFFSIGDAEAQAMSMNQRIWLEVGYSTLAAAGWSKASLSGRSLGIYLGDVGSDWHAYTDYFSLIMYDSDLTASALKSSVCTARLAHVLNTIGPTMTFDTACSSSLVATHHCHMQMINFERWRVQHEGGLCGGVNTLGEPGFVGNCQANMLSHIGRCFTFDRTADGYQRGEGAGAFFLKLSDTRADVEDRLACLVGSCANQDGRSASLTAPNGPSQQSVIRQSLRMGGITPSDVAAVECHGTGTALGDPIEVGALLAVLEHGRESPLPHTSAKSNISHLEAAAGVAGLLKCIAILGHSAATPNVHLRALNPHLVSLGFPQLFEAEITDLGRGGAFMGVSSFGFGGTNSRSDIYACCEVGPRRRRRTYDAALLDVVGVPCPRCLGQMCWRCGAAIPALAGRGAHRCSLVRADLADYEHCSGCYQGGYRYGAPLENVAPATRFFVMGTFTSWGELAEMEEGEDGAWSCVLALGDTRREEFQLVVDGDRCGGVLHPPTERARQFARPVGPEPCGRERSWLIDGFADGARAEDLYRIRLERAAGGLRLGWSRAGPAEAAEAVGQGFRHRYFLVGSWTRWSFQELAPEEAHVYVGGFAIGGSGAEEFQVVRDRDWSQAIYPAAPGEGAPLRGPRRRRPGRNFLVRGAHGEAVAVRLRVCDGDIAVEACGESFGPRRWQGAGPCEAAYFLAGSWDAWRLAPMRFEDGLHRCRVAFHDCAEVEFQVVADCDWSQRLHPRAPGPPGQDLVEGPDAEDGVSWRVCVVAGVTYEVVLDLGEEDRRRLVSWVAVGDPA